jgi:hypothetical protein
MTNYLRPDEQAAESEIRKAKNRTNELRGGLQTAATFGTAALGKNAILKVLPFLSEYIPEDLSLKGISKVVPKLGDFLKNGMNQGLSLKSGLDFLKKEISNMKEETKEPEKKEQPKENRNIIEQYSPELHEFIKNEVTKGRPVIEAGALAQNNQKYKNIIKKIEGDHKTNWSAILESIYGGGQYSRTVNPPQTQNNPQQAGQGQQALMAIMQKINQRLGG